MRLGSSLVQRFALLVMLAPLGAACAAAPTPPDDGNGQITGGDPSSYDEPICILHNCNSDAECGACSEDRTTCKLDEHRCVACDSATGNGCPDGEYCSSFGACVPDGVECPTDSHGEPTISCNTSADCVACDPMHRVCDVATAKCVACTSSDTSECQSTDSCEDGQCAAACPSSCDSDNDCAQCGAPGHEAHACNAHKCAECSATYACPAGETCSPQGVCAEVCGTDGAGACQSDADCNGCGENAGACHKAINDVFGECGPAASGCSDLGEGVAVLPAPFDQITNLCSDDGDCAGVGIEYNVGKLLRDLTGIDEINDANIEYGMNVCAAVSVGSGDDSVSCGVCVPCKVDADCNNIDIDQVAGEAFGPLGSLGAALLLDQVFGPNDHQVHMYCESVAGDYGVCVPCPGILYDCGVGNEGGGSSSGGGGTCDHGSCDNGGPLDPACDACAGDVCAIDEYCCTTAWDAQCISEAEQYCGVTCDDGGGGGGGVCAHSECTEGVALDASCSDCAASVCNADDYCCNNSWDSTCVNEVEQYCDTGCGDPYQGGSSSSSSSSSGGGGDPECYDASDCPIPDGCLPGGYCGPCQYDSDCYGSELCDSYYGECYQP